MNAGVHQYEDKLLDYAYGELPAHEAAAVDAHVRTCAKCSQALDQIKGVRSVFAPLPMVEAPDAGLESLLAYAEQHARRAKNEKQAPWRRWIFVFSSAAALLVVGVVAVRASKDSPQSAMDIVAGAEKETRKVESTKSVPEPLAVAPAAAPAEAKEEPQVWDERTGKRGLADQNSEEYANKADALQEKGREQDQLRLDNSPAKNDKARPRAEKPPAEPLAAGKKGSMGGGELAAAGAARQSEGKRLAPSKEAEAQGGLVPDYANSRGGYVGDLAKDAKKVAKTEEAKPSYDDQLNDGTSVKQSMSGTASPPAFGVSAGTGTGSSAGPGTVYGQVVDAPKGNAEQGRSQAAPPPPPMQAPAPVVAAPPSQPAPKTAQKSKVASNYGIMPRPSANEAAADEDAPQAVAESSIGDSSLRRQRDQQVNIEAQLGQARAAANQGDRRGQVAAAVRALSAGATGYSRAEALKSACDGYEALGEYDRAQQFCDLLISEFRGTAAAQQVAQRRKAQLKAPAAAPARQSLDLESDAKKPADLPAAAH